MSDCYCDYILFLHFLVLGSLVYDLLVYRAGRWLVKNNNFGLTAGLAIATIFLELDNSFGYIVQILDEYQLFPTFSSYFIGVFLVCLFKN